MLNTDESKVSVRSSCIEYYQGGKIAFNGHEKDVSDLLEVYKNVLPRRLNDNGAIDVLDVSEVFEKATKAAREEAENVIFGMFKKALDEESTRYDHPEPKKKYMVAEISDSFNLSKTEKELYFIIYRVAYKAAFDAIKNGGNVRKIAEYAVSGAINNSDYDDRIVTLAVQEAVRGVELVKSLNTVVKGEPVKVSPTKASGFKFV